MSLTLVSLALSVSLSISLVLLSSTLVPPVSVSLLLPLIFFPRHALHINFCVSLSDSLQKSYTLCLSVCVFVCNCLPLLPFTKSPKTWTFSQIQSKMQNKSFKFYLNALIQLSISVGVIFLCLQYKCMFFSDQQKKNKLKAFLTLFFFHNQTSFS